MKDVPSLEESTCLPAFPSFLQRAQPIISSLTGLSSPGNHCGRSPGSLTKVLQVGFVRGSAGKGDCQGAGWLPGPVLLSSHPWGVRDSTAGSACTRPLCPPGPWCSCPVQRITEPCMALGLCQSRLHPPGFISETGLHSC